MNMTIQGRLERSHLPLLHQIRCIFNVSTTTGLSRCRVAGAFIFQFNQVMDSPDESLEAFSTRLDAALRSLTHGCLLLTLASMVEATLACDPSCERSRNLNIVIRQQIWLSSSALARRPTARRMFISILDRELKPVFTGEPSGSKPNFVGEENPVELPWSGVMANISNRYHETIPGDTREWIEPEIKVELSSRDYFQNLDPVLESVLTRFNSR